MRTFSVQNLDQAPVRNINNEVDDAKPCFGTEFTAKEETP
jgi:hypothetical protein